jgi:predicted cupin superfamily sugar epimerase
MTIDRNSAAQWVSLLTLSPHPEGGYFKETYRSAATVPASALEGRFAGPRNVCTGIYYLLEQGDFSAFHRIKSDEMWHFYAGGALDLHILHDGVYSFVKIGRDVEAGEHLQYVVPAGAWFASRPSAQSPFSLVGCTVSPGFDFADFEMARAADLLREYPHYADVVGTLTRQ